MTQKLLLPEGWARPKGYANGIAVTGSRFLVLGGQIGWNAQQEFETDSLVGQVKQALENVVAVLAEGDARPEHVVRLTWYITDRDAYLKNVAEIGAAYREVMGRHFPAMSVVEVSRLVEERAQVEIEATAVLP